MNLYAWAHGVSEDEVVTLAARFPKLGMVLNQGNFGAADRLKVKPIAYVTTVVAARQVMALHQDGVPFHAVVVLDELNADGPSGRYHTPVEYAERFEPIKRMLTGGPPVFTMGLQPVGGLWREVFRARKFDDAYHQHLPVADGRAFNPNKVQLTEIHRVLRTYPGPWLLSPAPFRTAWDRLFEPVSVQQWARLSRHSDVSAVAMWCLKEVHGGPWFGDRWQSEHGLVDRMGNTTNVGLEVSRVLVGQK